jgi:hypothetical protein
MSSLRPWRLCGEISILDKNDLRPVYERGSWRDDQEPKCTYASLTPHFFFRVKDDDISNQELFKKDLEEGENSGRL